MPQGGRGQALCPPPASAAGGGRGDGQARETAGPEAGGREAGTFPQACAAPEHREPLPQHRGALLFAGTLLTGSASLAHSFPGSSQGFRRWWGAPGPGSRRSGWGVLAPFLYKIFLFCSVLCNTKNASHDFAAFQKHWIRTSLLAQRIRICLPVQGTWVQSLVQEDSTCRRATQPTRRNYCAHAPRACALRKRSPHTATGE